MWETQLEIPIRPRAHQVRYHGILAPCASGRDRIVPGRETKEPIPHATKDDPLPLAAHPTTRIDGPIDGRDAPPPHGSDLFPLHTPAVLQPGSTEPGPVSTDAGTRLPAIVKPTVPPPRRAAWAELLQRVFEVDALRCPACSGRMRILSAITEPDVARRILECVGMPSRAPPLGEATHSSREPFEKSNPEFSQDHDPGFDFDQSVLENV